VKHLWEVGHPYYCNEGNFYERGMHEVYDSWANFIADWGDTDPDMNLVFRWDWKRADPADYEVELDAPSPWVPPSGADTRPDALTIARTTA
jgi:hypothetical protein